jgi:hypothetical protein
MTAAAFGSEKRPHTRAVCETRLVGPSEAVARLVVVVLFVTRQVSGHFVRAFGMICLRARAEGGRLAFVVQRNYRQALAK